VRSIVQVYPGPPKIRFQGGKVSKVSMAFRNLET
jgi:hypothetical protein